MEEKNNSKRITFGTYAVIVTIVFLVLLVGILAGMLIEKNNEEKGTNTTENVVSSTKNEIEENVIDNNNENNIDTTSKVDEKEPIEVKWEKLVQFDNRFFKLKDIAKEYRECDKIKNYKDFNYDLDGDGVIDKITIRKKKDEQRI